MKGRRLFQIMLDEVGCLAHLAFLLAPGRRRPPGAFLSAGPRYSFKSMCFDLANPGRRDIAEDMRGGGFETPRN